MLGDREQPGDRINFYQKILQDVDALKNSENAGQEIFGFFFEKYELIMDRLEQDKKAIETVEAEIFEEVTQAARENFRT